jgi:hypothetical protein
VSNKGWRTPPTTRTSNTGSKSIFPWICCCCCCWRCRWRWCGVNCRQIYMIMQTSLIVNRVMTICHLSIDPTVDAFVLRVKVRLSQWKSYSKVIDFFKLQLIIWKNLSEISPKLFRHFLVNIFSKWRDSHAVLLKLSRTACVHACLKKKVSLWFPFKIGKTPLVISLIKIDL